MTSCDILLIGEEYEENLALRYLAAAGAKAGFRTAFVPLAVAEAAPREMLAPHPALIGLSLTFQAGLPRFTSLAATLRSLGYRGHLTAGGQFATVVARRLLEICPALDSVVRGEGEEALVELSRALREGGDPARIAGLTCRRDSRGPAGPGDGSASGDIIENPPRPVRDALDDLPRPVRVPPFTRQAGLPVAALLGSRGCLQGCTYCSIQTFGRQRPGLRQRFRTVADIVDEMAGLYDRHGIRIFVFHDDNFLCADRAASLRRARDFRDAVRRRGLGGASLVVKIRPDIVTEEIVGTLRDAGLVRAYVGIESGNARGLKVLGRGCTVEANHEALRVFAALDVFACYNLLVFHPETSLEEVREDIAFARAHPSAAFNVGHVEIYAGTPFERWLRRQGRLLGPEFTPTYRIADPRAEMASRIMTRVFHRRAFHIEGLLNRTASLGYETAARRNAMASPRWAPLAREVERLIAEVNGETCDALERIVDVAAEGSSPRRLQEVTADLAWEVSRRDLVLEDRLVHLSERIRAAAGYAEPEREGVTA